MRYVGVDPGLTRCGYGVVEVDARRRLHFVEAGVLRTPISADLVERLAQLDAELAVVLARSGAIALAVERVFSQHNVRTVMGTAQASALAMLAGYRLGMSVSTYTPSEVKAAVTGYGRADKAQVGEMVRRHLRLDQVPKPADAADALALAICHAWRGVGQARLIKGAS